MSADSEPRIRAALAKLQQSDPETAAELAALFEEALPRKGGKIRLFYKTVEKEPDPRPDGVTLYSFDNNDTIELRAMMPNGTPQTIAS